MKVVVQTIIIKNTMFHYVNVSRNVCEYMTLINCFFEIITLTFHYLYKPLLEIRVLRTKAKWLHQRYFISKSRNFLRCNFLKRYTVVVVRICRAY